MVLKSWLGNFIKFVLTTALGLVFFWLVSPVSALNIIDYSDTITDSRPDAYSNHTLRFQVNTNLSPGSIFEFTPPPGFEVMVPTSTFAERNVELLVDGTPRVSGTSLAPGVDLVEISPGSPGLIRYTLAPDSGVSTGSQLEFRVGNQTSVALRGYETYSTSTGTTTVPGDVEPVKNSVTLGRHDSVLQIFDGGLVAEKEFIIFLNEAVTVPNSDTTETVPPVRFNPAPTSTVGGTTLSVEISLETDEFSICRLGNVPDVDFNSMSIIFESTGLIYHSHVVAVVPNSLNTFYVRCIDDEGNYNIDDFLIQFTVNDVPTGTANTEGDVSGDGTGSGNDGTGTGSGSGGTAGNSSGEEPEEGGDAGTGGAGGGGGGGSGENDGSEAGGGFESTDAPYQSGDARVIISGFAYPNSTVGVLVDGNFVDTVKAGSTGAYSITLDEIARGVYTFGVYGEGPDKVRSSTFSTSFSVIGARTSSLSNINVAPSILVSPDPVEPGQTLTVSGYALPDAVVTIENGKVNSPASGTFSASADGAGRWSTTIITTGFSVDTYQVRAKSIQTGGASTQFSGYTFYGVGQSAAVPINTDLNRDGKVNLVDFSILLYWWNTDGGTSDPSADINQDSKVNLTDFSILLYNWTG